MSDIDWLLLFLPTVYKKRALGIPALNHSSKYPQENKGHFLVTGQ